MKKKIKFFSIILIALICYLFFLEINRIFYSYNWPFLISNTIIDKSLLSSDNIVMYVTKPATYILGVAFVFFVESSIVGYKNSSFYAISNFSSPSARTDMFYIFLKISGFADIIFNIIFLGFGFFILYEIQKISLFKFNNYLIEFVICVLTVTLLHYFYHRILHHPYFWELHKLHHSADEMNIFTASREHPIVTSLYIVILAIPVAIFGIRIEVMFVYKSLEGCYNLFLHSKVDLFPKWVRYFMITTKDHHIHHSKSDSHFNKNFGMVLNIWDKLFGTYYKPSLKENIKFGIDDKNYNKDFFFKEILNVPWTWIKENPLFNKNK